MKNYVIWTNCPIDKNEKDFNFESAANESVRNAYNRMFQISYASAKKFLAGNWEEIVWTDLEPSRGEMFQHNWYRVKELWHSEPCNILYLDADAMFIRPTEIFGVFKEFRMFNWTDPKTEYEFLNYFNAGVRYYPSTMRPETWMVGQTTADHWNLDIYDYEQIVMNRMFWSQHIGMNDRLHPQLNWQMIVTDSPDFGVEQQTQWNGGIPLSTACIIHAHGTRGTEYTLQVMESLAHTLNIETNYETKNQ